MNFVSSAEARKTLNLTATTLRTYDKEGLNCFFFS